MNNITIIRSSQTNRYNDCRRMTINRIINSKKKPKKIAISTLYGSSFHDGVIPIINSGNVKQGVEYAMDYFTTAKSKYSVEYDNTSHNENIIYLQLKVALHHFSVDVLPRIDPIALEKQYPETLIDRDIYLTGRPDLINSDGSTHDWKTGRDNNFAAQLGCYNNLRIAQEEKLNKKSYTWLLPRPNKKGVYTGTQRIEYDTLTTLDYSKKILNEMVEDILKDDLDQVLPNPCSNLCSENFCPLYGTNDCKITIKKGELF